MREMAVRSMVEHGEDARRFLDARYPAALRREAIGSLREKSDRDRLLAFLADPDPFLRHAAIQQLARNPEGLAEVHGFITSEAVRRGVLLAHRAAGTKE